MYLTEKIKPLSLLLIFILFLAPNVFGFNVKTHSYIGNEVLKDLSDGRLTIEPFGEFDVAPDVADAILNYPGAYLLGTLGPDSLPDMIGGQATVHTGIDGAWSTDDWLRHLSATSGASPRDQAWKALSSGYLSHSAADIFAHTYVNTYAGKEFNLQDEDRLDVEMRHFVLESYIAKFQPYDVQIDDLFGNVGYVLETYDTGEHYPPTLQQQYDYTTEKLLELFEYIYQEMVNDGWFEYDSGEPYSTYDYIKNNYIDTRPPEVDTAAQLHDFNRWLSREDFYPDVSNPNYFTIRRQINNTEYAAEGGVIYGLRPVANASDWDKEFTEEIADRLIRDSEVSNQYAMSGVAAYLSKMREFEIKTQEEAEFINVFKDWIRNELAQEIERQAFLQSMLDRYEQDGQVVESGPSVRNLDISDYVCPFSDPVTGDCTAPEDLPYCDSRNLQHRVAKQVGGQVYDLWLAGHCPNALISRYERELISESVSSMYGRYPEFAELGHELGFDDMSSNEVVETLALVAAVIVFYQDLDFRVLAIEYALAQYYANAVEEATNAYIFTSIEVAKNVHSGAGIEEIVTPIENWISCYGPIYTSEYASVMPDICDLSEQARTLALAFRGEVRQAGEYLAQQTGLSDEALAIQQAYANFKDRVEALAIGLGKDIVAEVLSDEQREFLTLIGSDVSDEILNEVFQRTGHSLELISIPDMSERAKLDMNLDSQGKFSPSEFAPVYNAIQLSKISLLDEYAINQLEQRAGISGYNYSAFYSAGDFSLIYSWVSSLDGNHQWMDVSPRYPRQEGADDSSVDADRKYSVGDGLFWWGNMDYRKNIFERIFKGPIAGSMEDPDAEDLSPLLPDYYKNRDCERDPFPLDVDPEKCGFNLSWLVPVLYLLNM